MAEEKIDPHRANGFNLVGDENGAAVVFMRAVYKVDGDKIIGEAIVSTAVAISWPIIEQLHRALGQLLAKRDSMIEASKAEKPGEGSRPN